MTIELSEQARELRNAYQNEWKRKNPDKVRKYNVDFWERKAAGITPATKARELYNKGLTQRQIAEELNVSLGTVNKYLNA